MPQPAPLILVVDDDLAVCTSLKLLLKRVGYRVQAVQRPVEVEAAVADNPPDLVLLDMNFTIDTSGQQGLRLLEQLKAWIPGIPIILMTAWATVQLAVEGMKKGARDFVAKPWDNKELVRTVRTILALTQPRTPTSERPTSFAQIVGQNPEFLSTLATAQRVAATDASVLILGESGTGKEVLAEAIHDASPRQDGPFVRVNLGGIATSLFESELFGHKKGAFTDAKSDREGRFGLADGGTIFLDEIGDLDLSSQVKLLRVLQEKTFEMLGSSTTQRVDVRVISATNKDLDDMVRANTFREDLYYRINLIKLTLPPLRERPGDIPLLAEHFVDTLRRLYQRPDLHLTAGARAWLRRQSFPGNIRELRNLVERTVLISASDQLRAEDLENHYRPSKNTRGNFPLPEVGTVSLEEMEIEMIRRAMQQYAGNITQVAGALGITRSALYRRLQKYGIPHES